MGNDLASEKPPPVFVKQPVSNVARAAERVEKETRRDPLAMVQAFSELSVDAKRAERPTPLQQIDKVLAPLPVADVSDIKIEDDDESDMKSERDNDDADDYDINADLIARIQRLTLNTSKRAAPTEAVSTGRKKRRLKEPAPGSWPLLPTAGLAIIELRLKQLKALVPFAQIDASALIARIHLYETKSPALDAIAEAMLCLRDILHVNTVIADHKLCELSRAELKQRVDDLQITLHSEARYDEAAELYKSYPVDTYLGRRELQGIDVPATFLDYVRYLRGERARKAIDVSADLKREFESWPTKTADLRALLPQHPAVIPWREQHADIAARLYQLEQTVAPRLQTYAQGAAVLATAMVTAGTPLARASQRHGFDRNPLREILAHVAPLAVSFSPLENIDQKEIYYKCYMAVAADRVKRRVYALNVSANGYAAAAARVDLVVMDDARKLQLHVTLPGRSSDWVTERLCVHNDLVWVLGSFVYQAAVVSISHQDGAALGAVKLLYYPTGTQKADGTLVYKRLEFASDMQPHPKTGLPIFATKYGLLAFRADDGKDMDEEEEEATMMRLEHFHIHEHVRKFAMSPPCDDVPNGVIVYTDRAHHVFINRLDGYESTPLTILGADGIAFLDAHTCVVLRGGGNFTVSTFDIRAPQTVRTVNFRSNFGHPSHVCVTGRNEVLFAGQAFEHKDMPENGAHIRNLGQEKMGAHRLMLERTD